MTNGLIKIMQQRALQIRKDIIQMTYNVGGIGAHIGGSLSLAEIISVLYSDILHFDLNNLDTSGRDRLIISKGHGVIALYSIFWQVGLMEQCEINSFKQQGSWLTAHPVMNATKGIDFSSGSLGHGLSLGVGSAWGLKLKENNHSKVYVILGDGECNEGAVWEAVMSASQLKLDNLIVIIDKNNIQFDDRTEYIISMEDMGEKWRSFGWNVFDVDGHDVDALHTALKKTSKKPLVIIAHTIKGKGVSFIENDPKYHLARLSLKDYELAMSEQEL